MTGRRQARHNGAPPQVDAIRELLEAEAARHEPDRAAIYRRVLDTTTEQRGRRPGRGAGRGRGPGRDLARARRVGIGAPRVVAGATAVVVVSVAVVTAVMTVDDPTLSPAAASPASAPQTPDSDGSSATDGASAVVSDGPSSPDGTRPEDNPPVNPPSELAAGTNGPASSPPAQDGTTSPGSEPQQTLLDVSEGARWTSPSRVALPGAGAIDWVLFGNGGDGVATRSATPQPAIEVDGPQSPIQVLEFSKSFDWTAGTPVAQGSSVGRLLLGSRDTVVFTVTGDPSQVRHLDLYLGSVNRSATLDVGFVGGTVSTMTRVLPQSGISQSADGIVTISFRPPDPGTRLRVVLHGGDTFYQPTSTIAAAVLR